MSYEVSNTLSQVTSTVANATMMVWGTAHKGGPTGIDELDYRLTCTEQALTRMQNTLALVVVALVFTFIVAILS